MAVGLMFWLGKLSYFDETISAWLTNYLIWIRILYLIGFMMQQLIANFADPGYGLAQQVMALLDLLPGFFGLFAIGLGQLHFGQA
jgi:hypothetical protein